VEALRKVRLPINCPGRCETKLSMKLSYLEPERRHLLRPDGQGPSHRVRHPSEQIPAGVREGPGYAFISYLSAVFVFTRTVGHSGKAWIRMPLCLISNLTCPTFLVRFWAPVILQKMFKVVSTMIHVYLIVCAEFPATQNRLTVMILFFLSKLWQTARSPTDAHRHVQLRTTRAR
jgi:hypothetical protein